MGTFIPNIDEPAITLPGATTRSDGSWASDLTAGDGGKSGTLEVQVLPAKTGSAFCKGTIAKAKVSL